MIKQCYKEIQEKNDVRQNLSNLRKEIKDEEEKEKFIELLDGEYETLLTLLQHEDAKTRKNDALLMGDLGFQEFLEPLYQAYCKEEQLFIKSAYLQAMKQMDYRNYIDIFKNKMTKNLN